MRLLIATAALALLGALTSPGASLAQSAAPAPTATPSENPAHTAIAKAQLAAWTSGKIDTSDYGEQFKTLLTPSAVSQVGSLIASGGAATFDGYKGMAQQMGVTVETYGITFAKPISLPAQMGPTTSKWMEAIAFDSDGKIVFLRFFPQQ